MKHHQAKHHHVVCFPAWFGHIALKERVLTFFFTNGVNHVIHLINLGGQSTVLMTALNICDFWDLQGPKCSLGLLQSFWSGWKTHRYRRWYTHVLGLVIGLGHIRADLKKITKGGDIPMYWDWELDWTISESIWKNHYRGWYTHVLGLVIGLGYRWPRRLILLPHHVCQSKIFSVGYPCIGIGCWIGPQLTQ